MNGHGDGQLAVDVRQEVLLGEEQEDAVYVQEAELADVVLRALLPVDLGQLPEHLGRGQMGSTLTGPLQK